MRKPSLVIGVCTRERPKMLRRCLESLAAQKTSVLFSIVVADNNDVALAQQETAMIADEFDATRIPVPKRGIASARNAILDYADQNDAEMVAFIDDDEWAHETWVHFLYFSAATYRAHVIYAPVILRYDPVFASWTDGRRQKKWPPLPEGVTTEHASTCNVMISRMIWGRRTGGRGLRFDTSFDLSGGEDSAFFHIVHELGFRMVWSNTPVVFERVPASRQRFRFFFSQHVQRGMAEYAMQKAGYTAMSSNANRANPIPKPMPVTHFTNMLRNGIRLFAIVFDGTSQKKQRIMIRARETALSTGRFLSALGLKSKFYNTVHGE